MPAKTIDTDNYVSGAQQQRAIEAEMAKYSPVYARAGIKPPVVNFDEDEARDGDELVEVTATENGEEVTVRINAPLSMWWFDVRDVIKELDEHKNAQSIRLLIESPGGSLYDGLAMYSDLRARADSGVKIITEARGVVASAATIIYMAGDERIANEGSLFMVHEPYCFFFCDGTADEITTAAKKITNALGYAQTAIRDIMVKRLDLNKKIVENYLKDETWFNAEEATKINMVTETVEESKISQEEAAQNKLAAHSILSHYRDGVRKSL